MGLIYFAAPIPPSLRKVEESMRAAPPVLPQNWETKGANLPNP